jgi:hypothetical protein
VLHINLLLVDYRNFPSVILHLSILDLKEYRFCDSVLIYIGLEYISFCDSGRRASVYAILLGLVFTYKRFYLA